MARTALLERFVLLCFAIFLAAVIETFQHSTKTSSPRKAVVKLVDIKDLDKCSVPAVLCLTALVTSTLAVRILPHTLSHLQPQTSIHDIAFL